MIADEEWINDESRTLPITIDPTFILDLGKNHIHDAHVNQNYPDRNYKLDYQLEVGKNGDNVYRTYIQYDLPDLPDCSVVTSAELTFVQNWARNIENTELYLNVYECGVSWSEDSITWNNQPISDISSATIVDYTNYVNGMSAEYNLDVTKIVKNWYENGNNYGLMLASSNESVEEMTSFYSAENWFSGIDSLHYPIIIIQYVNNNGIESYWDYETVSLDKSGTAYINTYNGGLTYLHEDASTNGLLASVSVSHVYSSDERVVSGEYRNMNFGNGFKLNLVEIIEASSVSGYPYKYIDADGTVHYFKNGTSNNQYIYEFDPLTVLTKNDSGFTMTFADGTRKHFDSDGYLTQITDSNSNTVSITYSNGKILNVTDGGGKSITFTYNTNNTLKTVVDTAGRITNYTYSNGKLTKIIYPDGAQTVYSYNSNGLLKNITSFSNEVIDLEYKTVNCVNRKIYRVSSVALKGNNQEHNIYDKLTFIYQPNGTVITNEKGDKNELAFDDSGRLISCYSNGKTITVAEYNNNGNTNNKPSFISNTFTPSENLGRRNKNTHYYYVNEAGNHNIYNERCKERLFNQNECFKVGVKPGYNAASNYVYCYTLPHDAGKTYSYTVFVNVVDKLEAGSVYLKAEAENSSNEIIATYKSEEITTTDNGWAMLSLTIAIPEDTLDLVISYGLFDGIGTVYLEKINYEESDAPGRVNLVYNSSFDHISNYIPINGWSGNYYEIWYGVNPSNGSKAAQIVGNPNYDKQLIQDIYVNGKAGDVIVFGGSAQALCSASGNDGYRFFGIKLFFKNANEALGDPICAPFNTDAYDVMQHIMASAVAPADYDEIEIWLCYDYEINSVIFDDIFLYRDYFGTDYVYDGNGRLSTMVSDSGQSIAYTYTGNNITGITAAYNGTVTHTASYTYDSSNNLLSAVGNDGVRQTYTYPSSGNKGLPVSVTVSDTSGENTSTTSYTYCDNYNYLESVTDPSGATVEYVYDNGETITKGLVTSVIDPNGNVTNYTYNSYNDELLSISNPSQELGTPTTEFTYTNGKVTGISGDEAEYVLSYDMFGRPTQTQGSGVTLMSCTYNDDSTLDIFTFGNDSFVEYSYNEDRQVTAEKYNGIDTFKYDYNTQGQLGRYTDLENNFTWEYFYDLAGRPVSSERSDGTKVVYAYDSKGNLSDFNVSFNGVPVSEMQYGYDALNRPVSVTMTAMQGSPSQVYSYDSLGRTQSISGIYSGENKVTSNYSYLVNNGNQTGRVSSVDFVKTTSSGSAALLPTLSYTYDANGNITHIYEGDTLKARYYYDGLNRLAREDNGYINKTVVYSYSSGGNILSKTEYALTNGTSLGTPTDTIEYQYTNARLPGGVTSYDGQQIIYDVSGNPIVYRGYGMEWDKGKRLTSITGTDVSMVCNYDSSGMRTWMVLGDDYYEFIYVGTTLIEQTINGDPMDFFYTASGAPYGFTYGGQNYFYLLNLQGDVIGIYDSNGNVVVQYTYDSWGKLISVTGSLANTIGVLNPLRYRGYYYDTNTGLYYLQSRYYDPETGRFINADTLIVASDYLQGTNMFAYCLNNPVMYVDPTGCEAAEYMSTALAVVIGAAILSESLLHYLSINNAIEAAQYIGSLSLSANEFIILVNSITYDLSSSEFGYVFQTLVYGTPNSVVRVSDKVWRVYGPDGRAVKDIDYGNNHPDIGVPHDHDWTWDDDQPIHGAPRPHTDDDISVNSDVLGAGIVVVSGVAIGAILLNDVTGIGISDDVLLAPFIGLFGKGLGMIGG